MIKIKRINWLDEASHEGEVILVDSKQHELICFIHQLRPDYIDLKELYAIVGTDIIKTEINNYCLTHIENFEHYVVGRLLDKEKVRIKCFDYVFETNGNLPGDIEEGDWIEFGVGRFNL